MLVPNIRTKIILPYLLLTLAVASIGTYVVTKLVAGSLDERLNNQLLEAGRIVSDSLARREVIQVKAAQAVAFTRGLAEALATRDQEAVTRLAQPVAAVHEIESLIVVDADGRSVLQVIKQPDGSLKIVKNSFNTASLWLVQSHLSGGDPNAPPKRSLGLYPANQRYYYFTALPVGLDNQVVGVVVVGTSLDTLVPYLGRTSAANVILYQDDGRAIGTTFAPENVEDIDALLDRLSISPDSYAQIMDNLDVTSGENTRISNHEYRIARQPLRVGRDKIGVFAVALPTNFITSMNSTNRNTYAFLFTFAAACVVLIGYGISQRITVPLGRLVRTSNAVAEGDLTQRTGIAGADEIGKLASTFDEMTVRLEDRTRALEQLLHDYKEAAGRMRAILSSIRDGVMLEDTTGQFIAMNAAAHAVLEEMAANFLSSPLRELMADWSNLNADLDPNQRSVTSRRFQVGNKVLSVNSAAVRTDDGQHLGNVIVMRDVTTEVEAERLKDAFVAHVSHELRTPLTAIKGYSDLLLVSSTSLGEQQRSFLQTIRQNTNELIGMINGLLDFSEMEAKGRLGLQRKPVSLAQLVQETAQEWQSQMAYKSLTFEVKLPGDQECQVSADAKRLRWAIINLVRNAWQYTPDGGQVTLQLTAHNGNVILDVKDTGVGISPQDQQRLFSRFFRASDTSDDQVRGLGLGLYVTKAIIEAHGGKIHLVSAPGAGSTFSVILPALPPASTDITTGK